MRSDRFVQKVSAAVSVDGVGAAGVECENLIVRAAVIGLPGTVGRTVNGRGRVVDDRLEVTGRRGRRARDAVACVGFGPAVNCAFATRRFVNAIWC